MLFFIFVKMSTKFFKTRYLIIFLLLTITWSYTFSQSLVYQNKFLYNPAAVGDSVKGNITYLFSTKNGFYPAYPVHPVNSLLLSGSNHVFRSSEWM